MVHNKVHADADFFVMAGLGQILKILHGSQLRLYFTEIGNGISTVGTSFRSFQKRHQMYIVYTTFLQIIKPRFHALQIACKIIHIENHAHHVILFIPFRISLPLTVQSLQSLPALFIETMHLLTQFLKHPVVLINFRVQPFQLISVLCKTVLVLLLLQFFLMLCLLCCSFGFFLCFGFRFCSFGFFLCFGFRFRCFGLCFRSFCLIHSLSCFLLSRFCSLCYRILHRILSFSSCSWLHLFISSSTFFNDPSVIIFIKQTNLLL